MARQPREPEDDTGFGETSRYAAHLDRGWSLLDRADFSAARQSAQHAQKLRPDAAEAPVLLGAIALAEGDPEESLRWYESAIDIDPEYLEPFLAAAQVALLELGDASRALQLCEEAVELEGISAFDGIELGLLGAEAQINLGLDDAASESLRVLANHPLFELATQTNLENLARDDAHKHAHVIAELLEDEDGDLLGTEDRLTQQARLLHLYLRFARLWLDLQRPAETLPGLRALVEHHPTHADAWHLLGESEHLQGNTRASCHAALRVYRLDTQGSLPKWLPNAAQIHRKVVQILSECPDGALRELSQRRVALVILVHEVPSMELILEGIDPRLPVLALASRGADETSEPVLTGLAIYRRNLLRLARNPENYDQELRFAVLEELALFLQLDDDTRVALGLHPLGDAEDFLAEADATDDDADDDLERVTEEPRQSRRRRRKRVLS